ncbi:MAG: NAD(P)-dependent oxidoreductase [Microbacteriaceae bacterium]|nr:NAD(P)-dependent oxidoreductase [Microbacteriaceae bacterium]
MRIGFAGLGNMGRPMALNLRAAGHEVIAYARSDAGRSAAREDGHDVAADLPALASGADLVILMLPDSPDVLDALWGDGGLGEALQAPQLLIDMSTIAPATAREISTRLARQGVRFIDAPVSGGVRGAESGSLTIMVGGTEADVEQAMPVLSALGSSITRVGDVGAGQVAKAANQMIVGGTIALVAEALSLAGALGVDPAGVREALLGGFAGSRILENHGARMLDGAFAPGFRSALQLKDLRIATDAAETLGGDRAPMTRTARDLFARLVEDGGGDLDHAGLWTLYETGRG